MWKFSPQKTKADSIITNSREVLFRPPQCLLAPLKNMEENILWIREENRCGDKWTIAYSVTPVNKTQHTVFLVDRRNDKVSIYSHTSCSVGIQISVRACGLTISTFSLDKKLLFFLMETNLFLYCNESGNNLCPGIKI